MLYGPRGPLFCAPEVDSSHAPHPVRPGIRQLPANSEKLGFLTGSGSQSASHVAAIRRRICKLRVPRGHRATRTHPSLTKAQGWPTPGLLSRHERTRQWVWGTGKETQWLQAAHISGSRRCRCKRMRTILGRAVTAPWSRTTLSQTTVARCLFGPGV